MQEIFNTSTTHVLFEISVNFPLETKYKHRQICCNICFNLHSYLRRWLVFWKQMQCPLRRSKYFSRHKSTSLKPHQREDHVWAAVVNSCIICSQFLFVKGTSHINSSVREFANRSKFVQKLWLCWMMNFISEELLTWEIVANYVCNWHEDIRSGNLSPEHCMASSLISVCPVIG